jgi:hypothetical protein
LDEVASLPERQQAYPDRDGQDGTWVSNLVWSENWVSVLNRHDH